MCPIGDCPRSLLEQHHRQECRNNSYHLHLTQQLKGRQDIIMALTHFTREPMCTYLSVCLMALFLYHIPDQGLVLVRPAVCSLMLPVQRLPFLSFHDPQEPTAGLEVVLSLKPHLLCGIHWVVLVPPLPPSYSTQLASSLDN